MLTSVYYNITDNVIFCISSENLSEFRLNLTDTRYLNYDYTDAFIVEYLSKACIFLGYL